MEKGAQFAIVGKCLQRLAFPNAGVAVAQIIADRAVEDKEAAIDPAPFIKRLFRKGGNPVTVKVELAESPSPSITV